MVPRSELLAALSQAKANKEDADSKAKDLAWLEEQQKKAQEQLAAARQEVAGLRTEVGGMVPRSDLEAAVGRLAESQAAAREAQAKHQELLGELNGKLVALEKDKTDHMVKMQVKQH
jgi:chromosome segregation ATPase